MQQSIPPVHLAKGKTQTPPNQEFESDGRSFSMTSAPPGQYLNRRRSSISLKSQCHDSHLPNYHSRHGHQLPLRPPPMLENRPPYAYPTRLKRPGYRSPSPALSDTVTSASAPLGPPMSRRVPLDRSQPPRSYEREQGACPNPGPNHLIVHPPPRSISVSPVESYDQPPPVPPMSSYPYRNPAAMRSAPVLPMPQPHGRGQLHRHPTPLTSYAQGYAVQPAMRRPPHREAYASQQRYAPYPQGGYSAARGQPAPPPNLAPGAHHMFHNAARMVRHLPQRTGTPTTGTPTSSDPPSSGTAPTSSDPPTPRDPPSTQVTIDPAFIDPALADLPNSSSDPVFAHQYLRYAEGLEKDVDDSDVAAAYPSVPPSGFVQRVKAMLESKAAAEAVVQHDADREHAEHFHAARSDGPMTNVEVAIRNSIHELAANEASRFTVVEEFEAPVELPASPVRLPELAASPVQLKRRITRELVKAGLAPSSVDNTVDQAGSAETTSIDMVMRQHSTRSRGTVKTASTAPQHDDVVPQDPSTPGPTNEPKHEDAGPGTGTTSSPIASGLSVVDYATQFDTTITSSETRSKDPFILDADTITLAQQQRKGDAGRADRARVDDSHAALLTEEPTNIPVSPMLPGEDISRFSAVSPLQTQVTLGVDETLRMASVSARDDLGEREGPSVPGAFPEETQPPPTPKTPKTYSKSVQLHRREPSMGTPSSNRYSLPPDLSTFSESTMTTTSDMVTDVAVRFSLPQSTVTVTRPQIVEIPPSSSPARQEQRPVPVKDALHTTASKSKRNSVTFADDIAPLRVNKQLDLHSFSRQAHEPQMNEPRSIVRRPSPMQEANHLYSGSRDSTADARFTGINGVSRRFGSTHLPGLKEESIDDVSVSDNHESDTANGFQFPLPARIAAVKAMQERRLKNSAENAKARRAHRQPNRPLAETRDLPSLNFSRMDLIDKLNAALEVRESKSIDVIRRREYSAIYCPSPQRPLSTEPLRERYMSFFNKPEDFSSFLLDEECQQRHVEDVLGVPADGIPTIEVQPNTEVEIEDASNRPLSPQDFLKVATEVNGLSIPSVTGLSDRLSELLPNLRDLRLDSVLANFGDVIEDIHILGDRVRPQTVLSNRTSAGFRTLAERAEDIVRNGTHDSTVPMLKLLNKGLPPLPGTMPAGKTAAQALADGKPLAGSVSAPSELCLARPASALTRTRSPMSEEEVHALLPPEMNPITRSARRALILSTGSSRPWNQDENYPWAGTKVDVDLTIPSDAHVRASITSEILRERRTRSLELTATGKVVDSTKGINIGSIFEHEPTTTITDEQLTGVSSPTQSHKTTKHSVMGSLTRKMGLRSICDGNTIRSMPSPTVPFDGDRSGSAGPHRPGERYPTSGLTPPTGFNLDEIRSFFSDSSSERQRNAPFRKRLTNFKSKKSLRLEPGQGPPLGVNTAYDAGEMTVGRTGAFSTVPTFDGVGMGKTEYRIKRFGERLRHLIAKGGELMRSLSQRSKPVRSNERERDEWLSDSLYSGV